MNTKKPISPEKALARAAALCSRCEKAESDIRNKLSSWGVSPDDADTITQRLIENRFLDEVRFASAFARDKFHIEGWGRVKIAYHLRMKRISNDVIEEALSHIDEDEYISILKTILNAKMNSLASKDPIKAKAAVVRHASMKGFETNLIFKYMPEFPDCDDYPF